MTSILARKKNMNTPVKKTREEYAEDALYREVWEDVNNEKTQQFVKKYWKYIVGSLKKNLAIRRSSEERNHPDVKWV